MPRGKNTHEGKVRMDLIPPEAIEELAKVIGHGAEKHGERDWEQGFEWSINYAAALRHLTKWWAGETFDESGHSHLAHALTRLAFLVTYEKRGVGQDDRPTKTDPVMEQAYETFRSGVKPPHPEEKLPLGGGTIPGRFRRIPHKTGG